MLGIPNPVNSAGILPTEILSLSEKDVLVSYFNNLETIFQQYETLLSNQNKNWNI